MSAHRYSVVDISSVLYSDCQVVWMDGKPTLPKRAECTTSWPLALIPIYFIVKNFPCSSVLCKVSKSSPLDSVSPYMDPHHPTSTYVQQASCILVISGQYQYEAYIKRLPRNVAMRATS